MGSIGHFLVSPRSHPDKTQVKERQRGNKATRQWGNKARRQKGNGGAVAERFVAVGRMRARELCGLSHHPQEHHGRAQIAHELRSGKSGSEGDRA